MTKVIVDRTHAPVLVVCINRPEVRNAVDGETAKLLHAAFEAFAEDDEMRVAVLTGVGGNFCAGADLKAILADRRSATQLGSTSNRLNSDMDASGPMGPTRLCLPKPVIAAISGFAVAGGLELACWCDLRVASEGAQLGVLCRLRGVPLIDGGTVRLPRLIGLSRAQDLILTGRLISGSEAHRIGLVNELVPTSSGPAAVEEVARRLAHTLANHPQLCMLNDRRSTLDATYGNANPFPLQMSSGPKAGKWNAQGGEREALRQEFELGLKSLVDMGDAVEAFVNKNGKTGRKAEGANSRGRKRPGSSIGEPKAKM